VKGDETAGRSAENGRGSVRVAAYCKASPDLERQQASREALTELYTEKIIGTPNWTLAGIYVERPNPNRKSKRPQFLKLMKDCDDGKIDCILCKTISIFLQAKRKEVRMLRHVLDNGIELIFEEEAIDTESQCFEMLISVLESFAERNDRVQSESIKKVMREKMERGEAPSRMPYGFRKTGDSYEIVPDEAEVVRTIFDLYEHGANCIEVAKYLSEKCIPTPHGEYVPWRSDVILRIISNEKHVGDYMGQKNFKDRSGREKKNKGELPTVYITDHHPAIISRERFKRCNVIRDLRGKTTPLQYPFGEYLRCPHCGHVLYKRHAPWTHSFCCEGEGACRRFVIAAAPVEKAILEAYEKIEMKVVGKKAALRDYNVAIEALKMLRIKAEHPVFEKIDYWWLDDLVEEISFGQHTCTYSELKKASVTDDRTISIHWRCGLISTVSSGVKYDIHDPRMRAEKWDAFILNHPDRYPRLAEEVQKQKDTLTCGSR